MKELECAELDGNSAGEDRRALMANKDEKNLVLASLPSPSVVF